MASSPEVIMVEFEGDHPQDWPKLRKWSIMITLAISMFLMSLSSTIVAPAADVIGEEFHTSPALRPMALSLFLLMYCLGPVFVGPLSELHGRWPIIQTGSVIYLAFNTAAGFSRSMTQLLVFRLLSGAGGSASLAVGASMVGDVFRKEERGLPMAVCQMGPILGSCLGPLAGGYIAEYTDWRWAFYATSIAVGVFLVLSFITARETYAPILLQRKKKTMMEHAVNMKKEQSFVWKTPYEKEGETFIQLYRRTLFRCLYFLGTQPIVQALACFYGYLFGLVYLLLASFSDLWNDRYHMRLSTGTLNYVAPCIGYLLGALICALLTDRVYRYQVNRNNGVGKPEFRLPMMIPSSLLVPIGLLWYGWCAEYKTHWILPDIGVALPLLGATVVFQCVNAYLLDTYPVYAASASGCVYIVRGLAGFGFPLFSPTLYSNLGYGWGNSLLALVALSLGCPLPFILWRYGARLRAASSYADHEK